MTGQKISFATCLVGVMKLSFYLDKSENPWGILGGAIVCVFLVWLSLIIYPKAFSHDV